jgi:hypothetical protein
MCMCGTAGQRLINYLIKTELPPVSLNPAGRGKNNAKGVRSTAAPKASGYKTTEHKILRQ